MILRGLGLLCARGWGLGGRVDFCVAFDICGGLSVLLLRSSRALLRCMEVFLSWAVGATVIHKQVISIYVLSNVIFPIQLSAAL